MPIRFDPGSGNDDNNKNRGGGRRFFGNRGSGDNKVGIMVLFSILFFVFRKPKLLFALILIGAAVGGYYYMKDPEGFKNFFAENLNQEDDEPDLAFKFIQGCEVDQAVYDKAEVFEPLANSSSKNDIPSKASLLQYAPTRRNQGQQGSCVGWASAYAARTILEAAATGRRPNDVTFSPSFLYNQIKANNQCQGSYTREALQKMKSDGVGLLADFPYNEYSCTNMPTNSQLRDAERYKIRGYNRLTKSGNNYDVDLNAIRQNIAQGAPVIIAVMVPPSFHYVSGNLWTPRRGEANRVQSYGGHAMCLIGYDDNYQGGAFQIMNSWGNDWGKDGVTWIRYDDFYTFCREAYGLYPHPKAQVVTNDKLEVEFGLVDSKTGRNIPLEKRNSSGGILFGNEEIMTKESPFKVEVTNSVECYTYVFGEETDGSSYVLFPYTTKHSAYCGIVGTRYFPKEGENLKSDDIGNRDYMAVVISKEPLDYTDLNNDINRARGNTYEAKVINALGNQRNKSARLNMDGDVIDVSSNSNNNIVAMVFEIDKE